MELRGEVHAMAEDDPQLLREIKIAQADPAQRPGCKLSDDIDVTPLRIEIVPQDRPKKGKRTNASLAAKAGDSFAIDRDGQLSNRHRGRDYHPPMQWPIKLLSTESK